MTNTRRLHRVCTTAAFGLSLLVAGCAIVPPPRLGSPWMRADADRGSIPAGALVSVKVEGQRATLPGQPDFANDEIAEKVKAALERRGFRVGADGATVAITLSYRTERHDYSANYSSVRTRNTNSTVYSSRSNQHTSPAVAIASLVSGLASLSSQSTSVSSWSEARRFFAHDVAICGRDLKGTLLWQSESSWDSDQIDISDEIDAFITKAMTSLPRVPDHLVYVPMLADKRAGDYYHTYCSGKWFSSPALPYRISFAMNTKKVELGAVDIWKGPRRATATRSSNWLALPLYLDLITQAEDALPIGADTNDASVVSAITWSTVLIAGRYATGRTSEPVNVLICLMSQPEGYVITDCHLVSDADYAKYCEKLAKWQDRVRAYWDFYDN